MKTAQTPSSAYAPPAARPATAAAKYGVHDEIPRYFRAENPPGFVSEYGYLVGTMTQSLVWTVQPPFASFITLMACIGAWVAPVPNT